MPEWLITGAMWKDIFAPSLPLLEKMLRPAVVYVFLVVLLSLSNTVQNAIIGNDNSLTGGLAGAFTLLALNYLVVRFLFRHRRLDQVLEGKPTALIEKGRVNRTALARELLTRSELMTVLHRQGFYQLEEVEECVLEPGGTFAIKRKEPPPSEVHYADVIRRLEAIDAAISRLAGGPARS